MKKLIKVIFSYYSLVLGLFLSSQLLKADELDTLRKKAQYEVALTCSALNFFEWDSKNEKGDEQDVPFAENQEREELEIARLVQKSENKQPILPYTTLSGKFGLYHILFNPTTDKHILQKRQQFIKKCTQDNDFYTRLQKLLKKAAQQELEIFSYWNKNDELTQKASSIYFGQPKTFFWLFKLPQIMQKLNQSSVVLELSTLKEFFKKTWYIIPLLGLHGITKNIKNTLLGTTELDLVQGLRDGFQDNINSFIQQYNFGDIDYEEHNILYNVIDTSPKINKRTAAFGLGYEFLFGYHSAGNRADFGQNIFRKNNITIPYPVAAGATLAHSLLTDYILYVVLQDQLQGITSTHTTLQKLHARTVAVARYIKTIEKIEKLLKDHPDEQVKAFYRDCLITKKAASQKMKTVINLLHTDTFKKNGSWFYLRGKVLLAHKLLQEVHTELTDRIRNIGLIDAHVATATLMIESNKKQMPTCFVEFVDREQPVECTITNGWSPLIICQNQVCNSVVLGRESARTIILTGPNGCGKSTILRVIGLNAWFAQTFGVGFANYMCMSLFDSLRTSLRINDNAATGLSTYMAADAAAERMQNHIDQANENHRSLMLYGEPYRGTPDQETTRKIMEFCHHIAPNKHFIMALETHVFEPTTLEKTMPQIFTNGHMEITEDDGGNFIRTFKLQDGPANWWFLDHPKRRRFVDWITVIRKQEEIAQKAYEQALTAAYQEALLRAKKEQKERIKKEKTANIFTKTINGFKSLIAK